MNKLILTGFMERAPARHLKFPNQFEYWSRDASTDLVLRCWTTLMQVCCSQEDF